MKKLSLLLLSLALAGCVSAPRTKPETTEYSKIIETNKPAAESFDTAMKWVARSFVSGKNVIQYSDKEAGSISGRALIPAGGLDMDSLMNIDVKDGRTRIVFTARAVTMSQVMYGRVIRSEQTPDQWQYNKWLDTVQPMVVSFQNYMTGPLADW